MKYKYIFILALILVSSCSNNSEVESGVATDTTQTYIWRLVTAWP